MSDKKKKTGFTREDPRNVVGNMNYEISPPGEPATPEEIKKFKERVRKEQGIKPTPNLKPNGILNTKEK